MELSELCGRIGADAELLRERMGGNETLVRRFLGSLPRDRVFDDLRRTMQDEDYPAAGSAAMMLKQFAECLEMPALAALCDELLNALRGGSNVKSCFQRLSDEYLRVVGEIEKFSGCRSE